MIYEVPHEIYHLKIYVTSLGEHMLQFCEHIAQVAAQVDQQEN